MNFVFQNAFYCHVCHRSLCVISYRDLYGDAMLVPTYMGTNMAAGNQQKHLSLSFATKA